MGVITKVVTITTILTMLVVQTNGRPKPTTTGLHLICAEEFYTCSTKFNKETRKCIHNIKLLKERKQTFEQYMMFRKTGRSPAPVRRNMTEIARELRQCSLRHKQIKTCLSHCEYQ